MLAGLPVARSTGLARGYDIQPDSMLPRTRECISARRRDTFAVVCQEDIIGMISRLWSARLFAALSDGDAAGLSSRSASRFERNDSFSALKLC